MTSRAALEFAFPAMSDTGTLVEIVPGILWTQFVLPFPPDQVNIYLFREAEGWTVLDTGIILDEHMRAWDRLIEGPLGGAPITRVIATHHHVDHIGLAGWLCERFGARLLTSRASYLSSQTLQFRPEAIGGPTFVDYYTRHGMSVDMATIAGERSRRYIRSVFALPQLYTRLIAGETLTIGGRDFEILLGEGHAPEQVMLYCRKDGLFFAADQVMERISPNISVMPNEPDADPLRLFLQSLTDIAEAVDDRALVLPGHRRPFRGLHRRCAELAHHHHERCQQLIEACTGRALTVAELVPVLFQRTLSPFHTSLAFNETMAHVNFLVAERRLVWMAEDGPVRRVTAA